MCIFRPTSSAASACLLTPRGCAKLRGVPIWTFMRHAQSVANAEGWYAGISDARLTPLGERQAFEARPAVAGMRFDRVFCSDLQRAHRTAQVVLGDRPLPIVSTPALRERSCGSWEACKVDDIEADARMDVLVRFDGCPPGGESLRDVATRAIRWLAEVDGVVDTLVVAHGALMRAVIGVLDGTPEHRIGSWRPVNCELVSREVPPGRWAELLDRIARPRSST